ncbi:MAG: GNAT family N-acetyltransferase [Chloroflexi bacterium]|nr:GNAT family N-acetyltransferase [Chloroflexota bacterium]
MSGLDASSGWQVSLDSLLLRSGSPRDRLSLTWLTLTSRWTHQSEGAESVEELLTQEASLVWQQRRTLRGAMLCSLYRAPVAQVRLLTLRERRDLEAFFEHILAPAEGRLASLGAQWLSLVGVEDWLAAGLSPRGYACIQRVIGYHMADLTVSIQGNGEVLVRAGAEEDLAAIVAVDAAAFAPFWRVNAPILREGLGRNQRLLVAELHGDIVGYVLAHLGGRDGYVSRLAVLPALQGRGIGARLLTEALAAMARSGLRSASLNTQEDNSPSRRLYERLGFEATGSRADFWAKQLVG